jgi:hypothetical protein
MFCDTSLLEMDYSPPIADYPDYPRNSGTMFHEDIYKSSLGSNHWIYYKGEHADWKFDWVEVSDGAQATMGIIVGSSRAYSPHVVIWEAQGIDGISLGSLQADVTPIGTYFVLDPEWRPQEQQFGLWNFSVTFVKEA